MKQKISTKCQSLLELSLMLPKNFQIFLEALQSIKQYVRGSMMLNLQLLHLSLCPMEILEVPTGMPHENLEFLRLSFTPHNVNDMFALLVTKVPLLLAW